MIAVPLLWILVAGSVLANGKGNCTPSIFSPLDEGSTQNVDHFATTQEFTAKNDFGKNVKINEGDTSEASSTTDTTETASTAVTTETASTTDTIETASSADTTESASTTVTTETTSTPFISETTSSTVTTETTSTTVTTETTTEKDCTEIPEVTFTDVTTTSFTIDLKWDPPQDVQCVDEYNIYLNDNIYENITSATNNYTINNLDACTEYTISIFVVYHDVFGKKDTREISTPIPDEFGAHRVEHFQVFSESESSIKTVWELLPKSINKCVKNYILEWWNSENEDDDSGQGNVTLASTETSLEVPLIWCMRYQMRIYPTSDTVNGGESILFYNASAHPAEAPNLKEYETSKTEVNLTWEFVNENSKCKISQMIVVCDAENFDYPWVIPHIDAIRDVPETTGSEFTMSIKSLSPYTNYSCAGNVNNEGGNSSSTSFNIVTEEEAPSPPENLEVYGVTSNTFLVKWEPPVNTTGEIQKYEGKITNKGPGHNVGEECKDNTSYPFETAADVTSYNFELALPDYNYDVIAWAVNGAGEGEQALIKIRTNASESDPVKNASSIENYFESEKYQDSVTVQFEPPCNTNGPLSNYKIKFEGIRENCVPHSGEIVSNATSVEIDLSPERNYSITITVETESSLVSPEVLLPWFISRSGVPDIKIISPPMSNSTRTALFRLSRDAFSEENGEIIAFCLILFNPPKNIRSGIGFWNGTAESWPPVVGTQLTETMWNPFKDGRHSDDFIIGNDKECTHENYCNMALKENTDYILVVRALTRNAYKDSEGLAFKTNMSDSLSLGLILGLIFGILAILLLIVFSLFYWRRRQRRVFERESISKSISTPASIPVQKFNTHYTSIKENYDIIKEEFLDLTFKSRDIGGVTTFALLPENKRKNRYTNILPFDETRVTLKIDEDDEISSDYINATFIKGYSEKIEYIATQGPLPSTARDFWKMVVQENVSIIVMVSQFVEQSKEKCYHYFPNNHETINFGEWLEVKCCTELHFGTYCIRTLQVRKGVEQRDVIHMQFLEWPDFGVPQGTDNMLQFCKEVREKVTREGGLIVVHCSAGVGRTGTLIALDILLQTIDDRKDINIYKTVFDLRRQRTNMVQTEKQYMFIYSCVREYIESPHIPTQNLEKDRVYENVEALRSSMKDTLIGDVIESAL